MSPQSQFSLHLPYGVLITLLVAGHASLAEAQFLQQGPKLIGTAAVGFSAQGAAVALSADGNTALVGGPWDDNIGPTSSPKGAAWVFTRSSGSWRQEGPKLTGLGSVGAAGLGSAVALSADGNTALVSGSADDSARGAVWVFTRSGGIWSQQGTKLQVPIRISGAFGVSVALSADGNTAIVGSIGAVWIFTRSGGLWTEQANLLGTERGLPNESLFGHAVSISADGDTAAVSNYEDTNLKGATWIFTRAAGRWSQQGPKLVGSDGIGQSGQGIAIALSGDGNSLIVGGSVDNSYLGACWIFTRSGGVWTQQGKKIVASEPTLDPPKFGAAVSMSADGNTAVIGGTGATNNGGTWVFTRTAGIWKQQGPNFIGSGATKYATQCCALRISADGNTVITGSLSDNPAASGPGLGAVWVFGKATLQIKPPTSVMAGVPVSVNVRAVWSDDALVSSVSGTVSLTSTDSQATISPSAVLSQGAGAFVATFKTLGAQTITAAYDPLPLIAGTSGSFSVVPPFVITAFANAASFMTGSQAPNTLVAAFGEFPNCASVAQISIDGVSTTVFAASSSQLNFLIPPTVEGRQTVNVQIACGGYTSLSVPMQIARASPAVFTTSQNGAGQAAIVNQDGSLTPPSAGGSVVTLYATGLGPLVKGGDGLAHTLLPVTAFIDGKPTAVLYAGEAPGYTSGLQQVNVLIPADSPSGGPVPLRLVVDGLNTQAGVTLAIR